MMRIEKLSATPDRAGRYRAEFEDGSVMRLYRQTVEDFGLYAGLELNEEQLERLRRGAGEMSAKMRAVRIVSASGVSRRELEQRLIHKGEDPDHAKQAVEWMESLDLVDDRKTAEQIVSRCVSRGYGPARARQVLYEKRIPKTLWDEALADYPDQADAIMSFLEARLSAGADEREIRRAVDALLRRGHSYSRIRQALDQLSLETEDYPEE